MLSFEHRCDVWQISPVYTSFLGTVDKKRGETEKGNKGTKEGDTSAPTASNGEQTEQTRKFAQLKFPTIA
jgi:hypothetical protein